MNKQTDKPKDKKQAQASQEKQETTARPLGEIITYEADIHGAPSDRFMALR